MKYLLVLVVVLVVAWVLMGRRRGAGEQPRGTDTASAGKGKKRNKEAAPVEMVTCTHCGVHLPQTEALTNARGELFCSDAHRLAGPRSVP